MDEKKLNDEVLEAVSGGAFDRKTLANSDNAEYFYQRFSPQNCNICARQTTDCPYRQNADKIYEAYGPEKLTCNERVAK